MNNSRNIADPDVRMLTDIAASLYADYEDDDLSWAGSPFAWINHGRLVREARSVSNWSRVSSPQRTFMEEL